MRRYAVDAIKHLTWPGRHKPRCWRCIHWTGRTRSGTVVCGDPYERCQSRRVGLRELCERWMRIRGLTP